MGKQHTPGPWFLNLENYVVNPLIDVRVAQVEYLDDVDQARANASLIVAAPELLRAAVAAMTIVNRDNPDGSIAHDLRAAIAKAEGRS